MTEQDKGIEIMAEQNNSDKKVLPSKIFMMLLLISFLSLSASLLLSRTIPGTFSLFRSSSTHVITFKAADTFPTALEKENNNIDQETNKTESGDQVLEPEQETKTEPPVNNDDKESQAVEDNTSTEDPKSDEIKSNQENEEQFGDTNIDEKKSNDENSSHDQQQEEVMEKDVPEESEQSYYRVRKEWSDEKSQIGAFVNEENATALANKNSGYKVFDPNGNEIVNEYEKY